MFEKVNPLHPDKIADRIAGAIVDEAYRLNSIEYKKYPYTVDDNPKIAVEVLIGHGSCYIICEKSPWLHFDNDFIQETVDRIANSKRKDYHYIVTFDRHKQNIELRQNQSGIIKCGDNGIFKGCEITNEERKLTEIAYDIYNEYPYDGKYLIDDKKLIICQSNIYPIDIDYFKKKYSKNFKEIIVNPLGFWSGGLWVDSGATNRKLGSDMGRSVTGGGLHGKDLSKADVSVNIYCWLEAQRYHKDIEYSCAIGDNKIGYLPYNEIVGIVQDYINGIGGFEKFAEWGLIRP